MVDNASTTVLKVFNSGNVGIGVTSPSYKLDVAGLINTDQFSGYLQAGKLLAYASSTNFATIFGLEAGGQNATTSATASGAVAVGYQALNSQTTGTQNTAVGYQALKITTTGGSNTAVGYQAGANVTGSSNSFFGNQVSAVNTVSGGSSTGIGAQALQALTSGGFNTSVGALSFSLLTTGVNNTGLGYQVGNETTGSNNIFIGYNTASTTTSGSNNIVIGYGIATPAVDSANTLNIGNLLFGTGINGEGTNLSTGNIGIGTTSPMSRLAIEQGADTQLGGLTLGANGDNDYRSMFMNTSGVLSFTGGDAGTFNTATLTAGGVWTDAPSFSWLKTDREVLGRDEMLEILSQTNIEKFKIIAEGKNGDTQIGIVLDEAHPALASHNAEGEIIGFSPMRVASVAFAGVRELIKQNANIIQTLALATSTLADIEARLASSTPTVTDSFVVETANKVKDLIASVGEWVVSKIYATLAVFTRAEIGIAAISNGLEIKDSNTGEIYCITIKNGEWDKKAGTCQNAQSTETQNTNGDTEAPVIMLSGNNPANIAVGAVYNDLGASVSDNVDNNLGVKASLNNETWIEVGNLQLSTASSTTYTIYYRAIDNAGNEGRAQRVVNVGTGNTEVVVVSSASEPETATSTPVTTESAVEEPPSDSSTSALESLGTATSTQTVIEEPMGTEEATSTPTIAEEISTPEPIAEPVTEEPAPALETVVSTAQDTEEATSTSVTP